MAKKVIILKCDEYDKEKIKEKIKTAIDLLNLKIPEKIIIKPNMLSAREPDKGITTHPIIISAIIEILKNYSEIIIGDSPANVSKPIEEYWEKCGYKEISERYNIPLKKFDISIPLSILIKEKEYKVPITSIINEYKVLNVAKFKTHNLTTLTLGVKNLYGLIPGVNKTILHSKFINPYDFSLFLIEFYKKIEENLFLTIVDGIIGMEGDGPTSGNLRKIGYIIVGEKAICVDWVCCKIVGIKPEKVDFIRIYKEKYGMDEIKVEGDKFQILNDFALPSTKKYFFIRNKFLSFLVFLLSKRFKIVPVINRKKCKRCYNCYKICPVKAISKNLKFDRERCILCFCCSEVCEYKAIEMKKSFIARIFT